MKKTFRKVLASLLVVVMLLTATPLAGVANFDWSSLFAVKASALDVTGQCGENVYWTFDESSGLLTISRSFFADSSYMLSFSVLCSCVCSRLISPSVSSWHKQDNTLMHQSPGHIQRRTPYNF